VVLPILLWCHYGGVADSGIAGLWQWHCSVAVVLLMGHCSIVIVIMMAALQCHGGVADAITVLWWWYCRCPRHGGRNSKRSGEGT
jgi:hypothetical protein